MTTSLAHQLLPLWGKENPIPEHSILYMYEGYGVLREVGTKIAAGVTTDFTDRKRAALGDVITSDLKRLADPLLLTNQERGMWRRMASEGLAANMIFPYTQLVPIMRLFRSMTREALPRAQGEYLASVRHIEAKNMLGGFSCFVGPAEPEDEGSPGILALRTEWFYLLPGSDRMRLAALRTLDFDTDGVWGLQWVVEQTLGEETRTSTERLKMTARVVYYPSLVDSGTGPPVYVPPAVDRQIVFMESTLLMGRRLLAHGNERLTFLRASSENSEGAYATAQYPSKGEKEEVLRYALVGLAFVHGEIRGLLRRRYDDEQIR